MKILVVNGPNLNLLGKREPEVYGTEDFSQFFTSLQDQFSSHQLSYFQSNHEGEIIDALQQADNNCDGVVLNAGGYSHTSVAIADAVSAISTPVIAVHISNVYQREKERHVELLAKAALGGIYGLGLNGYKLAIESLVNP